VTTGDALTLTGADQVGAALTAIPAAVDTNVTSALTEHGKAVVSAAGRLAPVRTGKTRSALAATVTGGTLTVDAGATIAPAAYTMHAIALGKSSGGFTFTVPTHTRRGSTVSGYKAARRIPNRPYLFLAWNAALTRLAETLSAAVDKGVHD